MLNILKDNRVDFKLYQHKPLHSVNESKIEQELIFPTNKNSVHIKNLFLRDNKKRNYLITCEQDKKIDLKRLKDKIESGRLSFGSANRLFQYLGVFPWKDTQILKQPISRSKRKTARFNFVFKSFQINFFILFTCN